jgi:protein tyrosine phosphatase (PTP) superfamily phosphohydrolase (DUF442 family)
MFANIHSRCFLLTSIAAMGLCLAGCDKPTATSQRPQKAAESRGLTSAPIERRAPEAIAAEHLPNPWRIHPKVISGGLPEGEEAFQELADLGVKTVISVDGAKPDVEIAKAHGLRYVHLPHGYDGISTERMCELAKAVRDLEGPIYIHCHHGKHRSPAAAAVACVGAGLLDAADSEVVLVAAGTSPNYRGLYEAARSVRKFEAKLLDELEADFPETAKLTEMAEAMVALEHTFDHLKRVEAAGWLPPADHPDIVPEHEALLLREHFTELQRNEAVQASPAEFRELLQTSEVAAQALETALREWQAAGRPAPPSAEIADSFARVAADCKQCHTTFRDTPLSEKL